MFGPKIREVTTGWNIVQLFAKYYGDPQIWVDEITPGFLKNWRT
jgi:hypothetical protein